MTISTKLSMAFSVAATFLLAVGIAAILLIDHLNGILTEMNFYTFQLTQTADAIAAVRVNPGSIVANEARIRDLGKWAHTDAERQLLGDAAKALARNPTESLARLDELGALYRKSIARATERLDMLHHRAVWGVVIALADSVLLLVCVMFVIRRWLLFPLIQLRDTAHQITRGNFDPLTASVDAPEAAELAASLSAICVSLRDLTERLEKAERFAALGEACNTVAHNLRAPLAAIRSHAQTVRNGKSTDPRVAKSAIEHILASVDTLDRWLREIGTTIRPLEVQLAKQAVEPIIHDSLSLLRPQLDGKEIEVDYHAADFLPDVKVDRALFEQALLAVLCNAIDASPEGGTIKITLAGADNGHLDLHIEDQGEGIPAEVSQRVFDAFFTTKPHASGLGLTCAKRILDLHGGQIRIESTAHSGTRVRILLPAVGAAVNQPKS